MSDQVKRDSLIIVPCTSSYLRECEALVKSLLVHMPNVPIHVISKDGEADALSAFPNVETVINEPPCDTEFRRVRTSRFRYALDVSDRFKVCCLLDADMLCVYNFEHVFRMADTGTIVACSNNTLFRYTYKDFQQMCVPADPNIDVVQTSFSTVPFFINPAIHREFLEAVWNNPTGNDLDTLNLYLSSMGLMKNVYLLNSQNWTNIHHTMLKPNLFVKQVSDGYVSDLGERVYMFHGHWLDVCDDSNGGYANQLIEPMIKNYGYHPPYIDCARNCINTMVNEYMKYYVPPTQEAL